MEEARTAEAMTEPAFGGVSYEPFTDIIYIAVTNDHEGDLMTQEVDQGVFADINDSGDIVGFEITRIHQRLDEAIRASTETQAHDAARDVLCLAWSNEVDAKVVAQAAHTPGVCPLYVGDGKLTGVRIEHIHRWLWEATAWYAKKQDQNLR